MDGDEGRTDARESSWVLARGRSVECELGAWGLTGTGYRVTENRDGLCISICMAR